jgi:hypothetical protein
MTASPGREVDANLLRGAAPGSAEARAGPDDAGGQDLGDLIEALGRSQAVGMDAVGHLPGCRALYSRTDRLKSTRPSNVVQIKQASYVVERRQTYWGVVVSVTAALCINLREGEVAAARQAPLPAA